MNLSRRATDLSVIPLLLFPREYMDRCRDTCVIFHIVVSIIENLHYGADGNICHDLDLIIIHYKYIKESCKWHSF